MASAVSVGLAVFPVESLYNSLKTLKLTSTLKSKMHRASTFPSNTHTLSFSITSILLLPCPLRPEPEPEPNSVSILRSSMALRESRNVRPIDSL